MDKDREKEIRARKEIKETDNASHVGQLRTSQEIAPKGIKERLEKANSAPDINIA